MGRLDFRFRPGSPLLTAPPPHTTQPAMDPAQPDFVLRPLAPGDHDAVIQAVRHWWDGRDLTHMLPRLFCDHFCNTSFAAERQGEPPGTLAGFLVGFLSPTRQGEGYVHFAGVRPDCRGQGLATRLYSRFFQLCQKEGRCIVRACTSPVNRGSIAFHTRLGFEIEPGPATFEGVPVTPDYNRPGDDKVRFVRRLGFGG